MRIDEMISIYVICEFISFWLIQMLGQLSYGEPFVQHVQRILSQSMLIVPYMEHNDDGMVPVNFVLLNKYMEVSCDNNPISVGIVPDN